MTNHIKAVVFDVDGCILNTKEFIFQAYEHSLTTLGLSVPDRLEMASHIGKSLEACYGAFAPGTDIELLRPSHTEFQEQHIELVVAHHALTTTLERIANMGIKLGSWSSRKKTVLPTLKHVGVDDYFESIVHGGMVSKHKPNPEGLLKVLYELSVEPSNAAMVGDASVDIEAGKAAEVALTIGITHGFGTREALLMAKPDYLVDSLEEVPPILEAF